jgi:serine/threonine protein phosphatase PrpC
MGIYCPECGCESSDPEFCDRCNTDLNTPSQDNAESPVQDPDELAAALRTDQKARLARPEAAVLVRAEGRTWRCHWVPEDSWATWQPCLEERQRHQIEVLPPCRILPGEGGFWIGAEVLGKCSKPWRELPVEDLFPWLQGAAAFVDRLAHALEALHRAGLVWLNFNPLALEETVDGRLRFTNLDLAVCPVGECRANLHTLPTFDAPEVARGQAGSIGPRTDVYHLALFTYHWLGGFLPHGFFGRGLAAMDFVLPSVRVFEPRLPAGLAPVLERGLVIDPGQRPDTPGVWSAEFRAAVARAESRRNATARIEWETGFDTRVGRAKSSQGQVNEDAGFIHDYTDPDRVAAVIADGVSCCDVGTGQIASQLTCDAFARRLGPDTHAADFRRQVESACREAGSLLLDWANQHGGQDQLTAGGDLMGTTVLAAWLEGRTLSLANIGDSRAYLIDGSGIEQLTVDGDLGNALLEAGVPPEEVRDMGRAARSLYSFVGGAAQDDQGQLSVGEHWEMMLTHWPLLPGDVVILCTDGLVEEGSYLEPQQVLELVRQHEDLPTDLLAAKLAEAADARQRLPSETNPEGLGDNITCCVIRVRNPG